MEAQHPVERVPESPAAATFWNLAHALARMSERHHLGLSVPSAVLPLDRNIVINPVHPAIEQVQITAIYDFTFDERMFGRRPNPSGQS